MYFEKWLTSWCEMAIYQDGDVVSFVVKSKHWLKMRKPLRGALQAMTKTIKMKKSLARWHKVNLIIVWTLVKVQARHCNETFVKNNNMTLLKLVVIYRVSESKESKLWLNTDHDKDLDVLIFLTG